jgi:tetratricopeptide (TPR) repeat protein
MKRTNKLWAILTGIAIATVPPLPMALALTPPEVNVKAQKFTVRIEGDYGIGSGIIVERQGEKYFVLTNHHVISEDGRYKIITPDGSSYPVYNSRSFPGLDLALLEFSSPKSYQTAQLGNSDQVREGMAVYVVGWANVLPGINEHSYQFTDGLIRSRLTKPDAGYALVYSNEALPGMSGGPVLDENGVVVGINGRGSPDPETGTVVRLGIPINYYLAAVKDLRSGSTIATTTTEPRNNSTDTANVDNWISLGGAKANRGDYEGAIADYNRALKINANNPDALLQRGRAYIELRDYRAAFKDFDRLVVLSPKNPVAYWGRGLARDLLEENQEAITDYSRAIALNPDYADAYNTRGTVFDELGENQKAISDYNSAIKIKPDFALAYVNRGDTYKKLKEYGKALQDYSQALKIRPNYAIAYLSRGDLLDDLGEYDKAIADLDRAIESRPNYANAYRLRGWIKANRLKQYQSGIADFDKAISIDPRYGLAYVNRGNAYRQLKDFQKAIGDYTQAIRLDSSYTDAYFYRGIAFNAIKKPKEAIADYTQTIRLDPNYADAYYNRGLILVQLKDKKRALADFRKSAELYQKQGNKEYYQDAIDQIRALEGSTTG